MTRQSSSNLLVRLAAIALVCSCAAIAVAPQAQGANPTIAVTEFANDAGAPQSTLDALGKAAYAALGQSGKFTPVGGGALKVKSYQVGGDLIVAALDSAKSVGADEIITTDLITASGGSVTYRMSAYRVNPLAFIRSGEFTQSSLSPPALTAGFVTNLATLHAPRTASGSIYSIDGGIKGDFGEATGAQPGDVYNVLRGGQKVAQAKVVSVDLNSATLDIMNPSPGYKPQVGDQLVGIGPQPAVPPPAHTNANTFSILALAAATGAALLAIGHHGVPAGANPAPTSTGAPVGFTVNPTSQTGTPPVEQFVFAFNQPVNVSGVVFATPTFVSYEKTNSGVVVTPAGTPVTNLGGSTPSFNTADTTLTINATTLLPNDILIFSFTSAFTSTSGASLTPTNITFTASVARHPGATVHAAPIPVRATAPQPAAPGTHPQPAPAPGGNGGHSPNTPR